ncbi:hypothetical protein Mag101_05390 [Microbulbifer agarilyticus]|uniref:DUF4380 domain-containing protein n=1 Tax=Microbulbifer agarilyticus TaxID=260552 RepID=A0A1Q2M390_9GAMM|nr:DUF4380 domain-containing protein [Microbulbifer agarilyticus]AQQ67140.1 hypothetical protein Mag101_05390 [Microbulbifer agarilyticus]
MLRKQCLKKCAAAIGVAVLLAVSAGNAADAPIRLSNDTLKLTLDPNHGGRITELWYGERDLLAIPQPGANNFGSTFWLSPQTLWNWPPIPEHDNAPYSVITQSIDSATVTSAFGAGAQIHKTVSLGGDNTASVHYRINAEKAFPEIAAWEITRVPNQGLAFAPVNRDSVKTVRGQVAYKLNSETLWLPMVTGAPLVEGKVIANGSEGWLAYALDGLLYLKVYPKVALREMATGEGDIELYLSGERPYLELEVQSAARSLQPGETLDWSVEWLVTEIPNTIEVRSGSHALLEFVRRQIHLSDSPD